MQNKFIYVKGHLNGIQVCQYRALISNPIINSYEVLKLNFSKKPTKKNFTAVAGE